METDELPILDSNVDFREVPPLHQKRTIAFVNHFILKTVSFLNTFATSCESRLMDLEYKLEKVEASLLILESQLSSIPFLNVAENDVLLPNIQPDDDNKIEISDIEVVADEKVGIKASEDSRYARFFKMVQVGVPLPAVKHKMMLEGLDPNILDTPNEIIAGCETNTITEGVCNENKM